MGGKGGGGDGGAQMMMQMQQQERRREEARERERREELARQEAEKAAEQERMRGASQQRIQGAYQAALQGARQQLGVRGLQADQGYGQQVMDLVNSQYDQVKAGAPDIVEDATTLFSPTVFDDAIGQVRTQRTNDLNRQLDEFAGDGFAYETFGDTAADDLINDIIGMQYGDARDTLDRSLARGQINEAGYNYADPMLSRQRSGGMSRAQDMAGGVLQGYRDQLNNMATGFRDTVESARLADNINLDVKRQRLGDRTSNLQGRMEGDIYNAIGDYQFFDTNSLLGKAGQRSGMMNNNTVGSPTASNINTPNLLASFEDDKKRAAGSEGAF